MATPIGNRADITLRALETLRTVDLVAAEDTRHTGRFLDHHDIRRPLISYHDHNADRRAPELVERLRGGARIALVTDAGTPALSDPGYRLVCAAVADGLPVVPLPGPAAALAALCASGLPTDSFYFAGFTPRRASRRRRQLETLASLRCTLIFYESPRRIRSFLADAMGVFGDRRGVLARELTKVHEEFLRGRLSEIGDALAARREVLGECTLLVEGAADAVTPAADLAGAVRSALRERDVPLSRLARELARELGVERRRVYETALKIRDEKDPDLSGGGDR